MSRSETTPGSGVGASSAATATRPRPAPAARRLRGGTGPKSAARRSRRNGSAMTTTTSASFTISGAVTPRSCVTRPAAITAANAAKNSAVSTRARVGERTAGTVTRANSTIVTAWKSSVTSSSAVISGALRPAGGRLPQLWGRRTREQRDRQAPRDRRTDGEGADLEPSREARRAEPRRARRDRDGAADLRYHHRRELARASLHASPIWHRVDAWARAPHRGDQRVLPPLSRRTRAGGKDASGGVSGMDPGKLRAFRSRVPDRRAAGRAGIRGH